jgi:surface carbohydrate biosynthesis protein
MKYKCRVLIVYERKNRELETAVLLREKLRNLGLECKITQFYWGYDFNLFSSAPDVLIVPHLYSGASVARLIGRYGRPKAIINLQYEQVLSEKWEKLGHHNPSDVAQNAIHVCWGKATFDRLRDFGVPSKNLLMIGAPHLDLLSQVDSEAYVAHKKSLSKQFGLSANCKWVLFLSSFTYADISLHRLRMNESVSGSNLSDFVEIHTKSRNEIIGWLEAALIDNPEKLFVYRPHPDELSLDNVELLKTKYSNFKVISFGSAKQWILASDTILSWYSTTVVESHYLKKRYQILRPLDLPDYFDSVLLKKAKFLIEKSEFLSCLNEKVDLSILPLKDTDVADYYDNIDGSIASDKLSLCILKILESEDFQDFKVPIKSIFRAKLLSICVLFVFLVYSVSKKKSLVSNVRKIKFFDRWFSEFDNQFYEKSEVSKIKESIRRSITKKSLKDL